MCDTKKYGLLYKKSTIDQNVISSRGSRMRPKNKKFYLGGSPLSKFKLTSYKYYIKRKPIKEKNYKYVKITTITNNATTNPTH